MWKSEQLMTLIHKMPFSALYWAGSNLRSFFSQFQGQFKAKNTFFIKPLLIYHGTLQKNHKIQTFVFSKEQWSTVIALHSISQKLGGLWLFEIIRLFKVYGGSTWKVWESCLAEEFYVTWNINDAMLIKAHRVCMFLNSKRFEYYLGPIQNHYQNSGANIWLPVCHIRFDSLVNCGALY